MPGRTINRIVELLDKTQQQDKEFCNYIGVAQSTFTNWKNRNTDPKPNYLPKIAEFFNVTVDYLVSDENPKEENVNIDNDIQNLISKLTGDNSIYFSGKEMTEEGKLALLNSLKQDLQFLNALHSKDEWED